MLRETFPVAFFYERRFVVVKKILPVLVFAVAICSGLAFAQEAKVSVNKKIDKDNPWVQSEPEHVQTEEGSQALETDIDDALAKMKADMQKENAKKPDPLIENQEM